MLDPTIVVASITGITGVLGIVASGKVGSGRERREAQRTAEARARSLDDYANTCRAVLQKAGLPVPPWPDELTDTRDGK